MDGRETAVALSHRHKENGMEGKHENNQSVTTRKFFGDDSLYRVLLLRWHCVSTGIFGLRRSGEVKRKGERETGAELWSEKCRKLALLLLKLTQKMTPFPAIQFRLS